MTTMFGRFAAILVLATAGSTAALAAEPRVEVVATVTEQAANLEGLDFGRDGGMFVTSNFDNRILRVGRDGKVLGFIALPLHPQVDLLAPDGGLIVTGHERIPVFGPRGPESVIGLGTGLMVVDRNGKVTKTLKGPDDAFFNGIDRLSPDRYIIADSIGGRLWLADLRRGVVEPWLTDVSAEGQNGKGAFGGANGLKVHKGWVYYTSRGAMWRVKVGAKGQAEGAPVQFAKQGGDDFDIAADGTIYIPAETALMKISPTGEVSKVADVGVNCPTARLAADGKSVFMLTRGPRPGAANPTPSRLLRVWL